MRIKTSIEQRGDLWVVCIPATGGMQELRCGSELQAKRLSALFSTSAGREVTVLHP